MIETETEKNNSKSIILNIVKNRGTVIPVFVLGSYFIIS